MTKYLIDLILVFFSFSVLGWCMEVILKYRQYHRFINRGFLIGPWLPIYGSGAVFITASVGFLTAYESGVGITFVTSFVICGLWEYFISYYLEKRFHARWWDYSQKPMNLNGRVWIGNLILFGLGGVAIIHIINPVLFKLFDMVSLEIWEGVCGVLVAAFAADFVLSHFVMKMVKTGTESSEADNTEEISKEIRMLFSDKAFFYRRFADAYPEVIYRTEKITARLEAIKAETERMRAEAESRVSELNQRIEDSKAQLASAMEPTESIRTTIIRKQDELIAELYDPNAATEHQQQLKTEIEEQKDRIRNRLLVPRMQQVE